MNIQKLEKKRKNLLLKLFMSGVGVSLFFVFGFIMLIKTGDKILVPLLFLVFTYIFIIYRLKFRVMNSFIQIYNETLFENSKISAIKYARNALNLKNSIKTLSDIKFGLFNLNDEFSGEMEGVKFSICDARLDLSNLNFKGKIFRANFNKNFKQITLISNLGIIKNKNLNKINIDSPKFGVEFDVFSNNLTESMYILSPSLIERLELLVGENKADILFYEDEILILLDNKIDSLEPNLFKPILEINADKFISEISNFKELIKFLKLDDKLYKFE